MMNQTHLSAPLWMSLPNFTDQTITENLGWSWLVMGHVQTKEQKKPELDKEHITGIDTHTIFPLGLRAHVKAPIELN